MVQSKSLIDTSLIKANPLSFAYHSSNMASSLKVQQAAVPEVEKDMLGEIESQCNAGVAKEEARAVMFHVCSNQKKESGVYRLNSKLMCVFGLCAITFGAFVFAGHINLDFGSSQSHAGMQAIASSTPAASIGNLEVQVVAGYDLKALKGARYPDPYVRMVLGSSTKKTETLDSKLNPRWGSSFDFDVSSLDEQIKFEVFHKGYRRDVSLGHLELPVREGKSSSPSVAAGAVQRKYKLHGTNFGELEISLKFKPSGSDTVAPFLTEVSQRMLSLISLA